MSDSRDGSEAERTCLGAVLVDQKAIVELEGRLRVEHFATPAHRAVYSAMLRMQAAGRSIDVVGLKDELGDELGIGGPVLLAGLLDGLPRVSNVAQWAGIVRSKAKRRAAVKLAERLLAQAHRSDVEIEALLDDHSAHIARLIDSEEHGVRQLGDVIPETMRKLEAYAASESGITGIPTSFPRVDRMTEGLKAGELWIVAGRPSRGKSAWCSQVAVHAGELGRRVLVFSMEMPAPAVTRRMVLSAASVDRRDLRSRGRSELAWEKVTRSASSLIGLQVWIDGREAPTLAQVRSSARQHQQRHGLDLVVVDYLQRMSRDSKLDVWAGVAENAKGLKNLALSLDVPVVAACQLTSDTEERRPTMADLAQARQVIAAEADVIAFLHPDDPKGWRTQDFPLMHFLIDKQRDGETRGVELYFERPWTRFVESVERPS